MHAANVMALSRERRRKRRTPRTDEELEDQEPLPVGKKVRYGGRDKLIARSFVNVMLHPQ